MGWILISVLIIALIIFFINKKYKKVARIIAGSMFTIYTVAFLGMGIALTIIEPHLMIIYYAVMAILSAILAYAVFTCKLAVGRKT